MKILLSILLLPLCVLADSVVPIDAVESNVNVRMSPDAASEIVGKLDQGSSAELVESIEGWHEIALVDGGTGYISADWTRVVASQELVAETVETEIVEEVIEDVVEAEVSVDVVEDLVGEAVEQAIEEIVEETVVSEIVEDAVADEVIADEVVQESVEEVIAEDITGPVDEHFVEVIEEAVAPTVMPEIVAVPLAIKGAKNYLVKFRGETQGGNSQIYDNGNQIGIGTTEPKQRLEVNGSIQIHEQNSSVAGLMITQSSGDTGYIMHNRASTLTIGAGSQDRITIDRDGNIGFAVSRPDHPLEMASGAHVTAGGAWTNSSSRDLKENIESLSASQATVALMALEPVVFNYRAEKGEDYVGFIAEDVPDLVATRERDALGSMDIVAVLTRVVQEQQRKIEELEARFDAQ